MNRAGLSTRLKDLGRLLEDMITLHQDLLEVLQQKLAAMRVSHLEQLQNCLDQEEQLSRRIRDLELLRRRLMVHIGVHLGLGEDASKVITINQLTARVADKRCAQLQGAARQLAWMIMQIGKVNTVVTLFARQMLEHYRILFEEMTRGIVDSSVYAPQGVRSAGGRAQVFDATG